MNKNKFESEFGIGAPVYLEMAGVIIPGHIRVVIFTNSKVRYSIKTLEDTTLHNLDSAFITLREGESITFAPDNYS